MANSITPAVIDIDIDGAVPVVAMTSEKQMLAAEEDPYHVVESLQLPGPRRCNRPCKSVERSVPVELTLALNDVVLAEAELGALSFGGLLSVSVIALDSLLFGGDICTPWAGVVVVVDSSFENTEHDLCFLNRM